MGKQWLVVRSKPRQEHRAWRNIERQHYHCYVPLIWNARRHLRELLFPCYLFVLCDDDWSSLYHTYGVSDVLRAAGGKPAIVDHGLIHALQVQENKHGLIELPSSRFVINQKVKVLYGPLSGLRGLYQGMGPRQRAKVLLGLLGGNTAVDLDQQMLVAI